MEKAGCPSRLNCKNFQSAKASGVGFMLKGCLECLLQSNHAWQARAASSCGKPTQR